MTQSQLSNHAELKVTKKPIQPLEQSINARYRDLTRRELQCLQISLRGRSARQAAIELGLSQRTVEEYLNNVKKKLGVTSKSEMINVAINLMLELL